jgi:hypothetical protein
MGETASYAEVAPSDLDRGGGLLAGGCFSCTLASVPSPRRTARLPSSLISPLSDPEAMKLSCNLALRSGVSLDVADVSDTVSLDIPGELTSIPPR